MAQVDHAHLFRLLFANEAADCEQPQAEYRFQPPRRWKFDCAWPAHKLAVEIDGGNRMVRYDSRGRPAVVGGHTKDSDYEKLNAAVEAGWRVLRYSTAMLENNPLACIEQVKRILANIGG